jgi:GntR family transcriptional repressor for pyruvate dehydrogenase complex
MELRAAIGTDAAALCAARIRPGQVTELGHVVAELTAADPADIEALAVLDTRFWDLIIDGSDNVCYRLSLNTLVGVYQPFDSIVRHLMADERRDADGHRAVVDAIAAGDAEGARAAARRLLARGTAALATLLAVEGRTQP